MRGGQARWLGASAAVAGLWLLLGVAGCSVGPDPATTVKLEITGVTSDTDRQHIKNLLKDMTDSPGTSDIFTYSTGDGMWVKLWPVRDVAAFAKKITFGKVTQIEGRTVRVSFTKPAPAPAAPPRRAPAAAKKPR